MQLRFSSVVLSISDWIDSPRYVSLPFFALDSHESSLRAYTYSSQRHDSLALG